MIRARATDHRRHAALRLLVLAASVSAALLFAGAQLAPTAVMATTAPTAPAAPTGIGLDEATSGDLLFRTGEAGRFLPAPLVRTHVSVEVSGIVARVEVSQHFYNPTDRWVEGIYVFPLPETGAVDRLRLRVGDSFIEGRIKERLEAEEIYRTAKAAGRKASLIAQQRPNIFANKVANIGPGEDVMVQIAFQQTVRFDAGEFSLRLPLVVAPRYVPGAAESAALAALDDPDDLATAERAAAIAADAAAISPPVLHPDSGAVNPVDIEVALDPGFPLGEVASPYHAIDMVEIGATRRIRLADGPVPADRDFVLRWRAADSGVPVTAALTETVDGAHYALVMMLPPTVTTDAVPRLPREAVFVIDTSGSMGGASIRQARDALSLAIDRLRPDDRFNVIRFSHTAERLFAEARPASDGNVRRAQRFVASLEADGGTEIAAALDLALDGRHDAGRLRQVVFLTDGDVGNEAKLFAAIDRRRGDSRLFTIGIGSAPNGFFMRKAAEAGRGSFTHIGAADEVAARMAALFVKLETPVLTDIDVAFPRHGEAEVWPVVPPDLYAGEPVVVVARLPAPGGEVVVSGEIAGAPWAQSLTLSADGATAGIAGLWARRKIGALMDRLHLGVDEETVRRAVVDVALAHHLVSRYTSLVAVDVTPSRPPEVADESLRVPVNLPAGWNFDKVFGTAPTERVAWPDEREALLVPAEPAGPDGADGAGAPGRHAEYEIAALPQGATPAPLKLLVGLIVMAAGGLLLLGARRQGRAA